MIDTAIACEVEGEEVSAELLTEKDELARADDAIAVTVAVEMEQVVAYPRCSDFDKIIAAGRFGVAVQMLSCQKS